MTQGQQDAVESQVGEGLKTCHESIQQLQHSISSISKAQPTVNLATVAHRQGAVGSWFLLHLTNCLSSFTICQDVPPMTSGSKSVLIYLHAAIPYW